MKENLIIDFIKNEPDGVSFKDISKKLKLQNHRELDLFLRKLIVDNKIYFNRSKNFYFFKELKEYVGIFRDTRHDFAFVEVEEEGMSASFFVPGKFKLNALNGDTVKIRVFPKSEIDIEKKREGSCRVVRIVKRNGNNIVGELKKENGSLKFIPDDTTIKNEVLLKNVDEFNLKEKQVLTTKFVDFVEGVIHLRIIEILSEGRLDNADWLVVANKYNLQSVFSAEALNEAEESIRNVKNENRIDLTSELIVTIDGETSKDLDDAISIKKNEKGNYVAGIHIADVSSFVRKGTQLDFEAYNRGTSVYLIDHVIPMLPKVLSNEFCSLNPNENKFTLSIEIELNEKCEVIDTKLFESVINSKYRLTYTEVDKFLENPSGLIKGDKNLSEMLLLAKKLSNILKNKKLENGMIDFQISETKVELDDNGTPINIKEKFQTPSEKLIEDFMVLANENVAKFLVEHNKHSLFRVHMKPSIENIENFSEIAKTFGEKFGTKISDIQNKDIMNFINSIASKEYSSILKKMLIQSMEKAIYSDSNLGHYALGLENYLHFTSPIRRYPDLIVHRTVKEILFKNNLEQDIVELREKAKWCSQKEKDSMSCERKLVDIKKAKYLQNSSSKYFVATITGISNFGVFVELENSISGFLSNEDFGNEFMIDQNKKYLLNTSTQEKKFITNKINVELKSVDIINGFIRFIVSNENSII